MLVFKENTDKPADIIQVRPGGSELGARKKQSLFLFLVTVISALHFISRVFLFFSFLKAKGMKKQIIDEFMSNNKFLLVPRLVNQKLFDELCPVKQFHRRRK